MTRKIAVLWLLSFFTLNTVFGAMGGVWLCLHPDLDFHLDHGEAADSDCGASEADEAAGDDCHSEAHETSGDDCHSEAHETSGDDCYSEAGSCVDIKLSGENLPVLRIGAVQPIQTCMSVVGVIPAHVEGFFGVREVDHVVQVRGPPDLLAMSVLVAQTVSLRI